MARRRESIRSELSTFTGFLRGLPRFLRKRMSYEEARAVIQERIRNRESNFLTSIERAVFTNPRSPYRAMLALAGCELGDLRRMVREQGLEAALRTLRASGVYVSFEEFKGTKPIERSGQVIPARPEDFDNPTFANYYQITTGGSSGAGRRVLMDLTYLESRVAMLILVDYCQGVAGQPAVNWFDIPPGHGLDSVLLKVPSGHMPERWFTPVMGGRDGTSIRFRLATQATLVVARMAGARIPWPELLPLESASVIARWARDRLREKGACVIRAPVSRALRVALAAKDEGIDLTGATIVGGAEPPTAAKVAQIRSTGAKFRSSYYFTEAGPVGWSCIASDEPNDQHFLKDHLAMIQAPRKVPGFDLTVPAFCFTTLLPTAPKFLLNVESDDYGAFETRSCGCPWEELGFTEHVSEIRSFKKLSGEGVTLIGSDMERILEEVLPGRFGGSPLDYQLVEEEDERGFTRLTLLVNPSVELADEQAAVDVVLGALHASGAAGDLSRAIWRQANSLRVRREAPRLTSRGKLMPLQLLRHPDRAGETGGAAGGGKRS